jgi:hypothetical protein
MSSDLHSSVPRLTHKQASFVIRPLGWLMARVRDLMVTAEVLHDIQWAAPWDPSPPAPSRNKSSEIATRR